VFLADEDDCASYYVCFNGDMIHRTCHPPLLWDHRNLWCNFPQNVICPSLCPAVDDPENPVFFPHDYSCSHYYLCFNGTRLLRNCSEGLIWDRDLEWCNFENETICNLREFSEYSVDRDLAVLELPQFEIDDDLVFDERCPGRDEDDPLVSCREKIQNGDDVFEFIG
jgi:Chitin binding Peritrophin-A domain